MQDFVVNCRLTGFLGNGMRSEFAEKLAKKMEDAGKLTPAALSRLSGVTRQNIGRILNNTPHPITGAPPTVGRDTVEKLAVALNWEIADALITSGHLPLKPNEPLDEEDALILSLFSKHNKLPPEQKEKFRPFVEMLLRELDVIGNQGEIRAMPETAQKRADFIPLEERESRVIGRTPDGRAIEEAPFVENPNISSRKATKKKNGTAG